MSLCCYYYLLIYILLYIGIRKKIFFHILVIFFFWRRCAYKSWPNVEECFLLALNVLSVFGAIAVLIVFLFTKPPAIEALSTHSLDIIGVFVPIAVFGYALPKIRALFFPGEVPAPPRN